MLMDVDPRAFHGVARHAGDRLATRDGRLCIRNLRQAERGGRADEQRCENLHDVIEVVIKGSSHGDEMTEQLLRVHRLYQVQIEA
jgi:hypothetical protein